MLLFWERRRIFPQLFFCLTTAITQRNAHFSLSWGKIPLACWTDEWSFKTNRQNSNISLAWNIFSPRKGVRQTSHVSQVLFVGVSKVFLLNLFLCVFCCNKSPLKKRPKFVRGHSDCGRLFMLFSSEGGGKKCENFDKMCHIYETKWLSRLSLTRWNATRKHTPPDN